MRELLIQQTIEGVLLVLRLTGFMAQLEIYKLKKQIDTALCEGKQHIILDLTNVSFIDSAGIGSLVQMHLESRKRQGHLVWIHPANLQVLDSLHISGIDKMIESFPSLEHALTEMHRRYSPPEPHQVNRELGESVSRLESQFAAHDEILRQIHERQNRIEELLLTLAQKLQ